MERISTQEDFVFGSVMSNKHLCQHLIQIILPELRINRIEFPTLQKAVQENIISRGVRFDVYTKDQNGVVYEIDMQVRHTRGLPQWVRYYQGRIDGDMLRHGQPYAKLRQSYVIFICPFDPPMIRDCISTSSETTAARISRWRWRMGVRRSFSTLKER